MRCSEAGDIKVIDFLEEEDWNQPVHLYKWPGLKFSWSLHRHCQCALADPGQGSTQPECRAREALATCQSLRMIMITHLAAGPMQDSSNVQVGSAAPALAA
jgi:hypothetical protein